MAYFGFRDEARYGLIMSVASIGSIVMTILLGLFGERINKIHGIGFGLALMGVAAILIGAMPLYIGSGAGYTLMLFYSLLAPLLVTSLTRIEAPQTFARPYLLLGIAAVIACVCIFWVGKRIFSQTPYANMEEMRQRAINNPAEIFRDARAWLYLLACFLYLCFQTGLSSWLPSYGAYRFSIGATEAGSILTMYFLGALAMRFISPMFYKRMKVSTFYMITIAVAAVLFLIFLMLVITACLPLSVAVTAFAGRKQ